MGKGGKRIRLGLKNQKTEKQPSKGSITKITHWGLGGRRGGKRGKDMGSRSGKNIKNLRLQEL